MYSKHEEDAIHTADPTYIAPCRWTCLMIISMEDKENLCRRELEKNYTEYQDFTEKLVPKHSLILEKYLEKS